ncbi:LacI family DNA-binding transcriptional regulator [Paracoccus sp. TOH]|uniref:LacI family DNA-binding transcriptional regulator n=1 Tax=Paracoccus sp. TOH TaxID=1263728 RepID=UPI0025B12165|nr:LacI family DNA-binding transcriptional regulator [Paracoccus sp. TOH]WJS83411.1 LacI family DNA-binding transcriptional regulator [Paracoccus sp. TOH]
MGKPTISDLARAAGVSPTTVSHAFSGRRHVDPETRERIHALAREMGYHPNSAAQRLRSGRTGIIALASSMPFAIAAGPSRLGFLMEIAASAAISALTRDIALCLIPPQPPEKNLDMLGFDGVILVEPARDDALVEHFESRRTPVVSIGKVPGRGDIPAIDLQSHDTARLLLDHLHKQGCRRIALVTGTSPRASQIETRAAYRDFAAAQAMPPEVLELDETGGEDLARAKVGDLLRTRPELDGLMVPVDAFASGALAAAHELGRAVPGDLRMVTRYDGLRAKLAEPPLTAVDLHLAQIAGMAVELLLDRIDGKPRQMQAPRPELVVRRSSAAEDNRKL